MKPKDKLASTLGYAVMAILMIGSVLGSLYWLTLQFSETVLRWVTVACILLVPASVIITWVVATNSAREHLRGFDRGLSGAERAIQSVGRSLSATASMARAAKQGLPPTQNHDDLLPRIGAMQILDVGHDDGDLIDL
ncbi:MAG: hypothetical protein JW850_23770 [Thermoflexales bacterium]|nr:hypothetical protein [Thermoflexales bacterium]